MRTQPQTIIQQLEADNSRLAKEAVLESAMTEGLDEFFEGVRMCLDNLYTFGVKQVPTSDKDGQGLSWDNFKQLAEALYRRDLTGHAARDAIQLAMDVATRDQWNDFYRRRRAWIRQEDFSWSYESVRSFWVIIIWSMQAF